LRPLKTLRDKTNDQTSEKPKSKPVMQTSFNEGRMRILEEINIEFLTPEACAILQQANCTLRGKNVQMERHFVMDRVSKAPANAR